MENEEEGGDSIEVAKEEMILEDDPNDDGIVEAIAEATQESTMESAMETHRLRNVQSCVSTH